MTELNFKSQQTHDVWQRLVELITPFAQYAHTLTHSLIDWIHQLQIAFIATNKYLGLINLFHNNLIFIQVKYNTKKEVTVKKLLALGIAAATGSSSSRPQYNQWYGFRSIGQS